MEWLVLFVVAAAVAAFIAWPRAGDTVISARPDIDELLAQRETLLLELREIDEDTLAGRISDDDRLSARRELGPRLRRVTEALREYGVESSS